MQLTPADQKARIARLDELARGLAAEVGQQKGAEDVLLFRERRQYLRPVRTPWPAPRRPGWCWRGW